MSASLESLVNNPKSFKGPDFLMDTDLFSKYLQSMTVHNDLLNDSQTYNYQYEIKNSNKQYDCIKTTQESTSTGTNISFYEKLCNISNNYFKILYIFSYIHRFLFNCKNRRTKQSEPLSLEELGTRKIGL